jgi:hypothetical protein
VRPEDPNEVAIGVGVLGLVAGVNIDGRPEVVLDANEPNDEGRTGVMLDVSLKLVVVVLI